MVCHMTERLQIDPRAFRDLRRARGISQAAVASEAGLSAALIGRIETGQRSRQARPAVLALARALGCSPAEFVVNYPPEAGRHRAAVERALAEAPAIDAEQARAIRSLLAGYAASAREERELGDVRLAPGRSA